MRAPKSIFQRVELFFERGFERGARITPHAILIDDLHWADESTLLLLQHLAQQLDLARVLSEEPLADGDNVEEFVI